MFLALGINHRFASPAPRHELEEAAEAAAEAQRAADSEARRGLPPELQARLAAAAASAAEALAAARQRVGGLSEGDAELAAGAASVAASTRSPFVAELACEVAQDIAAGREPDGDTLQIVFNPVRGQAETLGLLGPDTEEILLNMAAGRPGIEDRDAAISEALLSFLEASGQWEAHSRMFTVARGASVLQPPHLLVMLRRLPELVDPGELGFRARLRWREFVAGVLGELLKLEKQLGTAEVAALCSAVGRLGAPLEGPGAVSAPLQRLVTRHLDQLSVRQLGNALWAMGKAQLQPPRPWVDSVWGAMAQRSRQTPGDALSMSKGLFGCALLRHAPERALLEPFFAASLEHLGSFSPLQLSNTLWAAGSLAGLGLQPPAGWLAALLHELTSEQWWSDDGGLTVSWGGSIGGAGGGGGSPPERAPAREVHAGRPDAPSAAAAAAAVPSDVRAAASAAYPYLHGWPREGPTPCRLRSAAWYWAHLLTASGFGAAAVTADQWEEQGQGRPGPPPLVPPPAPAALLSLAPSGLLDVAEALAGLRPASDDAAVARAFARIWAAAAESGRPRPGSGGGGAPWDGAEPAAGGRAVAELQPGSAEAAAPDGRAPQGGAGFGSGGSKKRKQAEPRGRQQQQQSGGWGEVHAVDPQLIAEFDAASGGLWQAAAAGGWSLYQLAAAAAMSPPGSGGGGGPAAPLVRASRAVCGFMPAWFAASRALMPHAEPVLLVRTLLAVAALCGPGQSPYSPGLLPPGGAPQRVGGRGAPGPGAMAAGGTPKQQEQQPELPVLPPPPPAAWVRAAVQRMWVTRSAYSELALWHALDALAQLLQGHPQRDELLLQRQRPHRPAEGQGEQQYWWQARRREWRAAAAAGGPLSVAIGEEEDPSSPPWPDGGAAEAPQQQAGPLWAGSWVFGPSAAAAASAADGGGEGDGKGGSVFSQLRALVGCLGKELGTVLDVGAVVEALASVTRLSPALVDAAWLRRHEAAVVSSLQSQGWSGGGGGEGGGGGTADAAHHEAERRARARSGAAANDGLSLGDAVAAGLSPGVARQLLGLYAACGHAVAHAGLREACEQLVGVRPQADGT